MNTNLYYRAMLCTTEPNPLYPSGCQAREHTSHLLFFLVDSCTKLTGDNTGDNPKLVSYPFHVSFIETKSYGQ